MTALRTRSTSTASGKRIGYVVGAIVNAVVLWLVHVWPGWEVVPFLTDETPQVLGVLTASLVAGIVVDVVLLFPHPAWLTPAGLVVTSAFGLAVAIRVLDVFPFAFDEGFDWSPVVRVLLVLGVIGAAIGLLVAVVSLVRLLAARRADA
jgi:hypothetical protein